PDNFHPSVVVGTEAKSISPKVLLIRFEPRRLLADGHRAYDLPKLFGCRAGEDSPVVGRSPRVQLCNQPTGHICRRRSDPPGRISVITYIGLEKPFPHLKLPVAVNMRIGHAFLILQSAVSGNRSIHSNSVENPRFYKIFPSYSGHCLYLFARPYL